MHLRLLIAAALSAGLLATAALAAPPALSAQETADQQTVSAALTAPNFEVLAGHMAALQKVYDHAPVRYPMVVEYGDVTVVRADDQDSAASLAILLTAAVKKRNMSVVYAPNTYPMAAFLLATYANEMKRPEAALAYLDRGLGMQPENAHLVSEKAAALYALNRPRDAVVLLNAWLDQNPLGGENNRARLLRSKGYGLVELRDLNGAEAAYRESLKSEPDHKGARYELEYIAKLRAGGQQLGGKLFNGAEAKAGDFVPEPAPAPPKP
ncbi:MAG: hypothetical protein JWQ29_3382 [Phenylobacterium sp.]|nr:hypothetical protein [Phenylobacterium sp.]